MERISLSNGALDHERRRYVCEGMYRTGPHHLPVARVAIYQQQDDGRGDYVRIDNVIIDRRSTQETMRQELFLQAVWNAERERDPFDEHYAA